MCRIDASGKLKRRKRFYLQETGLFCREDMVYQLSVAIIIHPVCDEENLYNHGKTSSLTEIPGLILSNQVHK
jgi:hypothetical protein